MTTETVLLYTFMSMGHIHPTIELAKLFTRHGFAITIAIIDTTNNPKSAETVARLSTSNPSISFHVIPCSNPGARHFDAIRDANPALLSFLRSLPSVCAIVMDFLCSFALDVACELGIPAYFFYTCCAFDLPVFLHLPVFDATTTESFKDMGARLLHFPGVRPFPASGMPDLINDCNSDGYKMIIDHFARIPKGDGILINSFEWLEANAMKALKEGLCLPGQCMPTVYCVGPLVAADKGEERHECLMWLDAQPKQSVVFLCFGSMGSFSVEQLKEIATGLEQSGQRFLWVVRSPPEDPKNFFGPRPETDLDVLLPEGFLERTKGRGMVVKSWAPQIEVLQHEATGAFVTHCGWNSTLEGVTNGVPMLCWPLYAEQKLNKMFMVEEMKIGVEMKGCDEELVKAEEVEAKVRLVMESEEGKKLRERLAMAKENAAEASKQGGSSQIAFVELPTNLGSAKSLKIGGTTA